jgi:SAM-dependent methyltransferase
MNAAPVKATTASTFDAFDATYQGVVQESVAFSGLSYDFFLRSKAGLLAELMAEHLPDCPAPAVLDVGCGVGALHPLLSPRCGTLHGVDISAACIEQARRDNPGVAYQPYEGVVLPHGDCCFDMTLAICVMHHVPPVDRAAFTAELKRVTRPGGLVCVIEHNPINPLTRLSVMRCAFDKDAVLLDCAQTRRLLAGAGLTEGRSRYFLFAPSTRPWARKLERRLARLPMGAQYAAFARA